MDEDGRFAMVGMDAQCSPTDRRQRNTDSDRDVIEMFRAEAVDEVVGSADESQHRIACFGEFIVGEVVQFMEGKGRTADRAGQMDFDADIEDAARCTGHRSTKRNH